ncbi:MAG: HlyD family efflux transporter periplasmic adaptor subunit [Alphaproteobacteria bacterium]|nr:HlyD family efflux transporter periplasmic adaptor subunit [Alphaproteobacteria bacterium]
MRAWIVAAAVVVLGGGGASAWYWGGQDEATIRYRTAKVEEGPLTAAVTANGTLQAVTNVLVGSQLSGQISELHADFNTPVKKGQLIATLEADQIEARLAQAEADLEAGKAAAAQMRAQFERSRIEIDNARANLANLRAQTQRAEVALVDAEREFKRRKDLLARGVATTTDTDRAETARDLAKASLVSAQAGEDAGRAQLAATQSNLKVIEAQVRAADANVAQRSAQVRHVQVDLDRTQIRAPIDGVVVQRNVDLGQTVAASLTAPILFSVAQDLKDMEVLASVDEGDVGRIADGQAVTFTVTAFPETTFRGFVKQVRLGPQVVQNVVTYIVVISAANPDLRLRPGMTATVRIVTAERQATIKVPNAALRYRPVGAGQAVPGAPAASGGGGGGGGGQFPSPEQLTKSLTDSLALTAEQQSQVLAVLRDSRAEGTAVFQNQSLDSNQRRARLQSIRNQTAERIALLLTSEQRPKYAELRARQQAAQAGRSGGTTGQVFIVDGEGKPKAVALRLGIGDGSFTEILAGDLKPGQDVVVGSSGGAKPQGAPTGGPRLGF